MFYIEKEHIIVFQYLANIYYKYMLYVSSLN